MLSKTALGMAQIVGQSLAQRDLHLTANDNTPLSLLTEQSTRQLIVDSSMVIGGVPQRVADLTASLESGANEPLPGQVESDHTAQMTETTGALAHALGLIHDLTQNKVNPSIRRVVDVIEKYLEVKLVGTHSPLELVTVGPDPIFSSIYLRENVAPYARGLRNATLRNWNLPAPDVSKFLVTGHVAFDQELNELYNRMGQEQVAAVWEALFKGGASNTQDVIGRQGQEKNAVIAFVLGARLQSDIPAGLEGDLNDWRHYCSTIFAAAGATLYGYYSVLASTQEHGRMVLDYPREDNPVGVVTVDKSKYDAFCSVGGNAEMIFAEVYGQQRFVQSDMLARKDALLQDWKYVLATYHNARTAQRHGYVVEALRDALSKEIATHWEGEVETETAKRYAHMRDFCRAQTPYHTEDLWKLARYGVCHVVFPGTDALSLLEAMDAQAKISPDLNVRELAFYGTIELVAKWLFNQMQVSDATA